MEVRAQTVARVEGCAHCGRPVGEASMTPRFCCSGCQAARALIEGAGLGVFYEKLRRSSDGLEDGGGGPRLAAIAELQTADWRDLERARREARMRRDGSVVLDVYLEGITCAACAWLVEKTPLLDPRILRARVKSGGRAEWMLSRIEDAPEVARFFAGLGYLPHLVSGAVDKDLERAETKKALLRAGVASASAIASMHVSLTLYAGRLDGMSPVTLRALGWICLAVTLPAVLFSAVPFYRTALLALRARRLHLDLLVALSCVVGVAASVDHLVRGINETYFDSVAMLVALLLWGRLSVRVLETKAGADQRTALRDLLGGARELAVGDEADVLSGEMIPCDGEIVEGRSSVQCAWLTGEDEWRPVAPGAAVEAGSLNLGDRLRVRATAASGDSRVARLLSRLVEGERGKLQRLSERLEQLVVGGFFVGTALLAFTGESGDPARIWVALLMVTCPCALGLAVPAVYRAALTQALRLGIFVKNGAVLEAAGAVDTVVLDKTGTLTGGLEASLAKHVWDAMTPSDRAVLEFLSSRSGHPASKAVAAWLRGMSGNVESRGLRGWKSREVFGQGVECSPPGGGVRYSLLKDPAGLAFRKGMGGGAGELLAVFRLSERLQPEAHPAVRELERLGAEIWIASGDSPEKVEAIAGVLGVPKMRAISECSPEAKAELIESLKKRRERRGVLIAGDGFNDTLAFRRADVSVGVTGGAAAALEVSDIHLTRPDLGQLAAVIKAGRRVRLAVGLNFAWALAYNALGVVLVLKGEIGPLVAAVLMPVSSAWVIAMAAGRRYWRL